LGQEIILIGPSGAGKSTMGKLLARAQGQPQCSMDDVRWHYYREIGYDEEKEREIRENQGIEAVLRYWKPFEVHAVERLLAEHHDCVIDFGAGHTVFDDDMLFARVEKALTLYPNVVLLLPSPDLDESVRVLTRRRPDLPPSVNEHFVRHHCNHDLAKIVIYTQGQKPKETRDTILKAVAEKAAAS
jgi:adenylate kinase family enzyme